MLKKSLLLACLLGISAQLMAWGSTGHRTIGEIAERHLTKKAKKALKKLLDNESVAFISTFMDEIRSDSTYDYMSTWHYVTIPDGMTYEQIEKEERGDIIEAIQRLKAELKQPNISKEKAAWNIKLLAHLVGDIHQPLHVGMPGDRGGNAVDVGWHYIRSYNLHKVWDEGMIDFTNLSYSEFATHLIRTTRQNDKKRWMSISDAREWAYESVAYRSEVYKIGDAQLGYSYNYIHMPMLKQRLMQAGLRLAALLNEVYG